MFWEIFERLKAKLKLKLIEARMLWKEIFDLI